LYDLLAIERSLFVLTKLRSKDTIDIHIGNRFTR